jgi:glycolate oxidase
MELGGGFEVMKKIKRALDPGNIMNPGKYLLDQSYEPDVDPTSRGEE